MIVNDGSRDNTADIVRSYDLVTRASIGAPGGKSRQSEAKAIRCATACSMRRATSSCLPTPTSLLRLRKPRKTVRLHRTRQRCSDWIALAASRSAEQAATPLYRQILGRAFNLALKLILGLSFKDTQCGFKAFFTAGSQAKDVFSPAGDSTLGLQSGDSVSGARTGL